MGARAVAAALLALCAACGGDDGFDELPIVFVHGCPPPPINNKQVANLWTGSAWGMPDNGFTDYLAAKGYPEDYLNVLVYPGETCPPNSAHAQVIADYVQEVLERTGKQRVDLMTTSVGSVAGRVYLRRGGTEFVEHFVSLVGANHGSILAGMVGEAGQAVRGYPWWEGAFEVYPDYACDGESGPDPEFREEFPSASPNEQIQFFLNGCLTDSGKTVEVDETPEDVNEGGHIKYFNVWNDIDDLVNPPEASCLNQKFKNDCSDPVNMEVTVHAETELLPPDSGVFSSHAETTIDPTVLDAVYDFITE